jgi:NAD(P)-dependent dehydrogenase (short-subunit alcohol dehydrogenase family)
MPRNLQGKAVIVIGGGGETHRGIAVALAEAGADVAVAGSADDLAAEAALHSIANEIWSLGRRSMVVKLATGDAVSFAEALAQVQKELGGADVVVRCDPILNA